MTITELIKKLEEIRDQEGDLPVLLYDQEFGPQPIDPDSIYSSIEKGESVVALQWDTYQ